MHMRFVKIFGHPARLPNSLTVAYWDGWWKISSPGLSFHQGESSRYSSPPLSPQEGRKQIQTDKSFFFRTVGIRTRLRTIQEKIITVFCRKFGKSIRKRKKFGYFRGESLGPWLISPPPPIIFTVLTSPYLNLSRKCYINNVHYILYLIIYLVYQISLIWLHLDMENFHLILQYKIQKKRRRYFSSLDNEVLLSNGPFNKL